MELKARQAGAWSTRPSWKARAQEALKTELESKGHAKLPINK